MTRRGSTAAVNSLRYSKAVRIAAASAWTNIPPVPVGPKGKAAIERERRAGARHKEEADNGSSTSSTTAPAGGQAVIVNAIAYRSHSITNEPANKKMRKILPSALLHRRWLLNDVLPAVKAGKRKVIAHRPSLWDLDRTRSDFLFSTNPVSEHLSEAMRECASRWLASRH
jgi:hypothetical protein